MAKFSKLEMAPAISSLSCIDVKSSFFGLCQKVIYTPTGSPVQPLMQEYAPDMGERLHQILKKPLEAWNTELRSKGKPQPTAIGKFRLEACLSDDGQFCALQLLVFGDTYYEPIMEPLIFQGAEAVAASSII